MKLPDVQRRLRELALDLYNTGFPADPNAYADELELLADAISRRKRVTRAPVMSRPMSRAVASEVIELHYQHPEWPHYKIGQEVGVNPGRVSEVLAGKRR